MGEMITRETPALVAPLQAESAVRRVAAYCRVSTLAEEQDLSYETQCDYYTRLIEADPTMTLVEVYGDQGGSGLSLKRRPEFQRMMSDCLEGKIDLILTKSVSRFARNLGDCVNCVRLLREKGIPVMFEKEGITSTDPSCEMLLSVLASMAQQEVHRKLDKGELEILSAKLTKKAARVNKEADAVMANAAQAVVRWKKAHPFLKKVEYLFLDELVETITFSKWSECVITWKFGLTSRVPVKYDKVSEIPNVELTHTDKGYIANGEKVVAGDQVMRRLERIKQSCIKVREGGERPSALKQITI